MMTLDVLPMYWPRNPLALRQPARRCRNPFVGLWRDPTGRYYQLGVGTGRSHGDWARQVMGFGNQYDAMDQGWLRITTYTVGDYLAVQGKTRPFVLQHLRRVRDDLAAEGYFDLGLPQATVAAEWYEPQQGSMEFDSDLRPMKLPTQYNPILPRVRQSRPFTRGQKVYLELLNEVASGERLAARDGTPDYARMRRLMRVTLPLLWKEEQPEAARAVGAAARHVLAAARQPAGAAAQLRRATEVLEGISGWTGEDVLPPAHNPQRGGQR